MAEIAELHRVVAEIIYAKADPFGREGERKPFAPDADGVLRGGPLVAHMQARAVLEALGLLDGVARTVTGREYGTKFPERFEDDYVVSDHLTSRGSVLANVERAPGAVAVTRAVVRVEGPWRSIEA